MSFKAHNRLLISACLFILVIAFIFSGTLAAGTISPGLSVFAQCSTDGAGVPENAGCVSEGASAEPAAMLLFGIALTGFAYAARRRFIAS